ncbi:Ig-like domain-containing protein, partial [Spirosoma daeguense]
MKRYVYLFFLLLSLYNSHNLFAVSKFWTGNTNTDWNTANNWNPVGVPTSSDNVFIRDGTGNPVIATGTTATVTSILILQKTLTINAGGTLNVRGDGSVYRYIDLNINSTLINRGTLAIEAAGGGPVAGYFGPGDDHSLVENYGIIRINSSFGSAVEMGGPVGGTRSSAIINNYACGQFIVVSNNLRVTDIAQFTNAGYVYGNININNGGTFTNSNNGVLQYGTLSGTITSNTGSVIVNDNETNTTIFTYQGTYQGTVNGIYTNSAGTASAGSYNQTSNTFTPSGLLPGSQTLYARITPSVGGCTYIVPFTYTYVAPPNFTTDPTTKTVCTGSGTTFTASASGSPTYQWQVNTGSSFTNLTNTAPYSGVTTTTLTISNVAGLNGYQYRCVATNGGGTDNSNAATLTVSTISVANPPTSTGTTGTAFNQTFTASGGGTPRTFSLASGTLPNGLNLTAGGGLQGTPTEGGSFPITVRATDVNNCSGVSATYSLQISTTATITTTAPAAVLGTSATLGGTITADGGTPVTERGVVYLSGSGTPTTSNTKVQMGAGTGPFSQSVSNLSAGTSYSVRAYAINGAGTSYGNLQTFTTASAPAAPIVTTPANGSRTNDNTPTYTGTAVPNSSVTVTVSGTPYGPTTVNGSGNWTFTQPTSLADNTYTVSAVARLNGLDSPISNTNTFIVDTTPPPAPVVVTPANGSTTNDNTPTYSGTAEANSTVSVLVDGTSVGNATVNASGNWTFTQPTALAGGSHTVRARATDAAGNTSVDSNTNTFIVDTTPPPAPVVVTPANGSTTND